MKSILMEIVNRLSDMGASLDAMEGALVASGVLQTDAIGSRFQTHKGIVDSHLAGLRAAIALLPD
jgi:hypothetical protein